LRWADEICNGTVVDYRKEQPVDVLGKQSVDFVFDTVGDAVALVRSARISNVDSFYMDACNSCHLQSPRLMGADS